MYHQYFGLKEAPFSIAVNPRYLYMSPRHRDALAHMLYGVGAGGGFILLTGEVGTGKTTINRCLLEQLPDNTDIAVILNPALNAVELLATACDELGIAYDPDKQTLKTLTDSLHRYLLDNHARGRNTVLIIDEAQHLDFDVLEQIRLLTNLETNSEKLLQIILIGQPELAEMLAQPKLRQLNQRITARYDLGPLSLEETGAYIRHRLQVAGVPPGRSLFPDGVVKGIYKQTRGVPRLINVLCDRMLLGAYGRNKSRVDTSMLRQAILEVSGKKDEKRVSWLWAVCIFLVVLIAGFDLWLWWGDEYVNSLRAQASADSELLADGEIASRSVSVERTAELTAAPTPELARPEAAVAIAPVVIAQAPPEEPVTWLLPRDQADSMLWRLLSPEPRPRDVCGPSPQSGLACVDGAAQSWEELAELDRPILLDMMTADNFFGAALLLGIEDSHAWLGTDSGAFAVSLAELRPRWSGKYRFLWRPPAGFQWPLTLGDDGSVVQTVALMFAELDQQQQPLTEKHFNVALQQRVRLFQREHGLLADGVAGRQTLLKLNQALGIEQTVAAIRERMGYAGMVN